MVTSKLVITLPLGLQARNTVSLLRIVYRFNSECIIIKNELLCPINVDNIIKLMMLDIVENDEVVIIVNGGDELLALNAIETYLMHEYSFIGD